MPNNIFDSKAGSILNSLILPLVFIALSAIFFLQDLLAINDLWLNNHSYDTGYPVFGLCLLFSYMTQVGKPTYTWQPSFGLLFFALCAAIVLYIATNLLTLQSPRLLAYLAVFIFFIAINTSPQQRLNKILVFGLLFYAIPIWGVFTPLLQTLTIKATSFGLQLSQIPATIHGTYISLPGGTLEVEEGCAGLHYLVTTLLICHIFCILNSPTFRGWVLMFLSGTVLALIANWIRVYILSHVAYVTDLQHPWMHDHTVMGQAVYALIYIPLYFLSGTIMTHCKIKREFSFSTPFNPAKPMSILTSLCLSIIIIAAPYAQALIKSSQPADNLSFNQPDEIGLCYHSSSPAQLIPNYNGYDQLASKSYDCTEGKIYSHQFIYRQQIQGKELINIFNTLLNDEIWRDLKQTDFAEPLDFSVQQFANNDGAQALVAYTYIINGKASAANKLIRSEMLKHGAFKQIPAAMIAVSMPCKTNCQTETVFLQRFFIDYFNAITQKRRSE